MTARGRALFSRAGCVALVVAWLLLAGCTWATGSWREAAPLPEARWFHAAARGSDGRIYAYGGRVLGPKGIGQHGVGEYSFVVYDPARDAWQRGPEVPFYRALNKFLGTLTDTKGKVTFIPKEYMNTIALPFEAINGASDGYGRIYWFGVLGPLVFDPGQGTWAQPPGPVQYQNEGFRWEGPVAAHVRKNGATATSPDGKIYLLGGKGRRFTERGAPPWDLLKSVDVYDPATNSWSEAAPMRERRQLFAAAFGPDGKLYAFGGYAHTGLVQNKPGESAASFDARVAEMRRKGRQVLSSVEVYDPETDTWEPRAPMPVGLEGTGATLGADGGIYLVGGTRSYSNPVARRQVYVYDPRLDSWSEGPSLRTGRQGHRVVGTPEGRIYAIGGTNGRSVFHPRELVGGDPATRGGPLTSVEFLETAPIP